MWRHLTVRTKRYLTLATVTLAAAAAVVSNLDTILSKAGSWVDSLLRPHAEIEIRLESERNWRALVAIALPSETDRVLDTRSVTSGETATFRLPANARYVVFWQGAGIKAARIDDVLVSETGSRFRLVSIGRDEDLEMLALRFDAPGSAGAPSEPASPQPAPASLLLSASAASAAGDPGIRPPTNGVLPELDRAAAVVGLFETGTTDCARGLFVAGRFVSVGCLGISVPGLLPKIVTDLDGDVARLDGLLGTANAKALREALQERSFNTAGDDERLVRGIRQLTATQEFWIAYQELLLEVYAQAIEGARTFGLMSDRGVLFVLDRIVQQGPRAIGRLHSDYEREIAALSSPSEKERLSILGDLAKRSIGRMPEYLGRVISRRIDTIVSGKGTVRGVDFNLDELGITTESRWFVADASPSAAAPTF